MWHIPSSPALSARLRRHGPLSWLRPSREPGLAPWRAVRWSRRPSRAFGEPLWLASAPPGAPTHLGEDGASHGHPKEERNNYAIGYPKWNFWVPGAPQVGWCLSCSHVPRPRRSRSGQKWSEVMGVRKVRLFVTCGVPRLCRTRCARSRAPTKICSCKKFAGGIVAAAKIFATCAVARQDIVDRREPKRGLKEEGYLYFVFVCRMRCLWSEHTSVSRASAVTLGRHHEHRQ